MQSPGAEKQEPIIWTVFWENNYLTSPSKIRGRDFSNESEIENQIPTRLPTRLPTRSQCKNDLGVPYLIVEANAGKSDSIS